MARNTPPTLSAYAESTWNGPAPSKTAAISWNAGDVITVIAGSAIGTSTAIGLPTASGLTFTSRALNQVTTTCGTRGATAVAGSSGSGNVSVTFPNSSDWWGFGVWVWSGSDGFDNAAEQHTSTRTVGLTHGDTHDGVAWGVFDFGAHAITGISLTPTPTHTRQAAQFNSSQYSGWVADLVDQASSGSVSYGVTAGGTGTGPYSIVVIAVLGTTVGAGGGKAPQTISPRGTYFHHDHDPSFERRGGCDRRTLDLAVDLGDPRARAQARRRSLWTPRSVRLAP